MKQLSYTIDVLHIDHHLFYTLFLPILFLTYSISYHIFPSVFILKSFCFLDNLYRSKEKIHLLLIEDLSINLSAENSSQVEMSLIAGLLSNRGSLSRATPMARLEECMDGGDSGFCCQLCREGVWSLYFIFGQNGKHLAHRRCPSFLHRPCHLLSFRFLPRSLSAL